MRGRGGRCTAGNFFGQPAAFAADLLASVTAQLGNLAERQLDLLVDPARNGGLPPMLATEPGAQHGLQGVQLATTAFVAEIRRNATPRRHAEPADQPAQPGRRPVRHPRRPPRPRHGRTPRPALRLSRPRAAAGRPRRRTPPTAPRCAEILDTLIAAIDPVDPDRPLDEDVRTAARLLATPATP
ncbi:hypothetical protein GCM10020256_69850 [Streptomyces thermocoprophilus]